MEDCNVINDVIKLSQKSILDKLCLQKASFVNRTIEKSREAYAPEEVWTVFLAEKVLFEVASEVTELL